jgi:hypothetical protein
MLSVIEVSQSILKASLNRGREVKMRESNVGRESGTGCHGLNIQKGSE